MKPAPADIAYVTELYALKAMDRGRFPGGCMHSGRVRREKSSYEPQSVTVTELRHLSETIRFRVSMRERYFEELEYSLLVYLPRQVFGRHSAMWEVGNGEVEGCRWSLVVPRYKYVVRVGLPSQILAESECRSEYRVDQDICCRELGFRTQQLL